jgi:solute:Na+ symporter, SSS family
MLDASLIVLQFLFFLVLGLCLYAFYGGATVQQLGLRSSDEVFPKFIIENLPRGVTGFVIAGVLASAMGSLSSSISSLASSSYLDLFRVKTGPDPIDGRKEVLWSRIFTLIWGVVLICGAMLFTDTKNPVVELGLKIASITYGGLLGTFFLGLLSVRTDTVDAFAGFISALAAMVAVLRFTTVDFTWHTFIGCAVCMAVGNGSRLLRDALSRRGSG